MQLQDKILNRATLEKIDFLLIKAICDKPSTNIILNEKKVTYKSEKDRTSLYHHCSSTKSLKHSMKQKDQRKKLETYK